MRKIKKDYIIFLILFIIGISMYWNWVTMHYATDTYNIINIGYEQYAINWSLLDGRLIMAALTLLAGKLKLSIDIFAIGTLISAIFISCIGVIKIKNIILRDMKVDLKNEILIIGISFFTIFNFMYIENMYFVECIVMAISILCYIYAADFIVQNKNIIAIVFVVIGIISYQATIGFLIALTFLLTILKNRNDIKKIFKDLIKSGLLVGLAIVTNTIIIKIIENIINLEQARMINIDKIWFNFINTYMHMNRVIKDNASLFPEYLLIIFICIIILLAILYDIKTKEVDMKSLKLFFITIISIASAFLISIGTLASFETGRIRFPLGALIGLLLIFIFKEMKGKKIKIILSSLIIIYGFINIVNCIQITHESKIVNKYEMQKAQEIGEYIQNEEQRNNIQVTKIATLLLEKDMYKLFNENVKIKSVVTYNALACKWSSAGAIRFYTNRNLKEIKLTNEQLEKYVQTKGQKNYAILDDIFVIETYMD